MSDKKRKISEVVFDYTGTEEREDITKEVTIVRFHSSVTEVRQNMFAECEQLNKVVLNEGLQKIGGGAFSYCSKLENINLPSSLIEIDSNVFEDCEELKKVVLNEGLQKIGYGSFYGCRKLEHITIPSLTLLVMLHFVLAVDWRRLH